MIYKSTFKDINDKEYTVRIVTEGDTSNTTEIVLGQTPFTTEIETSDSHIYKPCKYSSATIKVISSDYMFDIYAKTAQANKVELIDYTGAIRWIGYTTPNLYSMGYENMEEEIEIEAIDGLSTLQYFEYTSISESKGIVSIISIIDHLLAKCNCYNKYYISTAMVLNGTTDNLSTKMYISENNFFDEDGDAMTMQEVLEEICQYLGLTCIANGGKVLFLDYDAIKNDVNTYHLFNIGDTSSFTEVTLSQSKAIEGTDYAENGGQISLDNVYNKVTVKDSLYTFDEVIPDIFDEDDITNITSSTDTTLSTSTNLNNGAYGEVVCSAEGNTIAFIDKIFNEQHSSYRATVAVGVQYYKNPNYQMYDYGTNSGSTTINYTNTHAVIGAVMGKFFSQKLDKTDEDITSDMEEILNGGTTLEKYLAANEISKFDYTDCVVLLNPTEGHISNDNSTSYPFFKTTLSNASALFGGQNAFLLISGNVRICYAKMGNKTYPVPNECFDPSEGRYGHKLSEMYVWAKLKWGSQYWNGSSWQTTDCNFKLPFSYNTNKYIKCSDLLNNDLTIKNTVTWKTGSNKKGYCIKCPSSQLVTGMPELTIYSPLDYTVYKDGGKGSNQGNHYPTSVMFLKNFKIEAAIGDPTFNDEAETDTEYTNVIDEDFVEELDGIEFKICTWDNKKPNYSAVAYKNTDYYLYIDKLYHNATKQLLRAEEHLIYKLVNQYSTPSTILSLNLKNDINLYATCTDKHLANKTFIVDSMSVDWEMDKTSIKLIEKK